MSNTLHKSDDNKQKNIVNPKLHEIKQTKAISWKKFAENAGLNYTVLADVLNNRRHCTLKYAKRLIAPLAEYNIIVTAEEITGILPPKTERIITKKIKKETTKRK